MSLFSSFLYFFYSSFEYNKMRNTLQSFEMTAACVKFQIKI